MGTGDGTVLGPTKIVDHGSDADRWNLVLVSEGYRSTQMGQFQTDAQNFVNTLFATAPFNTLQSAINVHRVDVTSTDSGAGDPTACGGSGANPATYFDASFCNSGVRRLLLVNNTTVLNVVNAQVPAWDAILVIVNSTIYGGAGGAVGTMSLAAGANEIGMHEMGHTAFGLADEYEYWGGCGVDTNRNNHPAVEPAEPNVTTNINRSTIKWGDLILASTPLPTTDNGDCTQCDPQPNPLPADTVGAYEGAHYYHCDAYRPQFNCRMRMLGIPFCAVCRRVIVNELTPHLPKSIFKEIKDAKAEKLEKFEKFERKELKEFKKEKHEIPEKWHKPEKLEAKEWKELKPEIEDFKDRGSEVEIPRPEIFERLELLETTVQQLSHFITREQRPDLSLGALQAEPTQRPPARQSTRTTTSRRRTRRG
jgi:hypothetical protein